jgi:hypothetical protein
MQLAQLDPSDHVYGGEYGREPRPGENIPAWLIFDQQYRNCYIGITTRFTQTPNSPPLQAFPGRSCTDCVPTG